MPRPFEKLRDMPVRIPQVQPAATSADTRVNCHRPAERHATRRDRPFKPFLQVVAGNADMRESDVRGALGVPSRRGREILEKLDPRAYIRTWLADDGLQISAGLLLLEQRAMPIASRQDRSDRSRSEIVRPVWCSIGIRDLPFRM